MISKRRAAERAELQELRSTIIGLYSEFCFDSTCPRFAVGASLPHTRTSECPPPSKFYDGLLARYNRDRGI